MKVLFFDYWTKGLPHFLPVHQKLREGGHEVLLFHLGSKRDPCPAEETLHGVSCRDIAFYGTSLAYKVLERERPDVVLTLNARTLFDRAITLACRKLGIRTVFLAHGIDVSLDNPEQGSKMFERTMNKFSFIIPRVHRYLSFVLPNYFYSWWKLAGVAGVTRGVITVFQFARNPGRSVLIPPSLDEVSHDSHLLFSDQSASSFRKMGYPEGSVFAVGNPKYDELLKRLKLNQFSIGDLPEPVAVLVKKKRPFALVLEDSFPETANLGGWTTDYRNQWLRTMSRELQRLGQTLVVKLHPSTVYESVDLANEPAIVVSNADLNALIYFSAFCIAHVSTTVDNCVLLDRPVVTPIWGLSANVSDYFIQLGVSRAWRSPAEPPDTSVDEAARARYKRDRITVLEPIATENVVHHLLKERAPRVVIRDCTG